MAFIGQTVASTIMPYHMMSMMEMNGQEQSQNMSMMAHHNHNMAPEVFADSYSSEKSMEDCCSKTCNSCFTGGCSNIAVFMKDAVGSEPIADLSSKILSCSSLALSQQPTSLYRPPILS
ncbi:hypothetical protein FCS21_14695 [Colwellia ponticola]|uniref:Uncharacterized protein n=1 Tax=Colwellia ponticola TaxID=2304625 RepID=A0A8H2JJ15_9GAMM|nr:hypothetical protein FCS21_14695 [Colwellia ponticola]